MGILSFGLHLFLLCAALVIWKSTFFPALLLPASRTRALWSLSFMFVSVSALYFVLVSCCIAGANVGDGPGFGVVLFCAALSTTCLFLVWVLVAQISGAADVITIDRDLGTGIRAGGFLAGAGIVLGVCVAGDWISLAATLKDFARFSWPVAIGAYLFAMLERAVRGRSPAVAPSRTVSILVAAAAVVAGAVYAQWVGRHS